MMVVVMGPDGCGKSTIIQGMIRELSSKFSKVQYYHLYPPIKGQSLEPLQEVAQEPHGKAAYNLVLSILKLMYLVFLYQCGYLIRYSAIYGRDTLVIFDRYYHDILIDPLRFRYGGPHWLLRIAANLIPRPNLYILLDAPTEVLQSRKQEVPFSETQRQREAYLELFTTLPNSQVLDSTLPVDEVVQACTQLLAYSGDE
jgi:thymidylate kinase